MGQNGRNNINNKIYNDIYHKTIESLLPEDLLGVLNFMLNLAKTNEKYIRVN